MRQIVFSWPEGKAGALTTSWDDGTVHDRRLVGILNTHGLKGTFNLNAGYLGKAANKITVDEVVTLFQGHEVACHSFTHPSLERVPEMAVLSEMVADRSFLERLVGCPVQGMALPNGSYDKRVNAILKSCGIVHSRTTRSHGAFQLPEEFVEWHPTCHHKAALAELWEKFMANKLPDKLFYLWGHSYEFDRDGNWEVIEKFCAQASAATGIWHATNMDIYEYVTAWRGLVCAVDMGSVRNRSGVHLWFRADGAIREIGPGETVRL